MKRGLIIALVLHVVFVTARERDLLHVRELYYKASVSKRDAELFSREMEKTSGLQASLHAGYTGVSWMIRASHAVNPYNKLAYFIKGRDLLDAAIAADASNVELRFLRYCVQTNAPAFLSYRDKIADDKRIILMGYHQLADEDLKTRIRNFMDNSTQCTKEEKAVFHLSSKSK